VRAAPGAHGEILNPNAKLYRQAQPAGAPRPRQPEDRACLEAFERELDVPWALYRAHRLFLLSETGKRRPVIRSTKRLDIGRSRQLAQQLIFVSERHGVAVEHDPLYGAPTPGAVPAARPGRRWKNCPSPPPPA